MFSFGLGRAKRLNNKHLIDGELNGASLNGDTDDDQVRAAVNDNRYNKTEHRLVDTEHDEIASLFDSASDDDDEDDDDDDEDDLKAKYIFDSLHTNKRTR